MLIMISERSTLRRVSPLSPSHPTHQAPNTHHNYHLTTNPLGDYFQRVNQQFCYGYDSKTTVVVPTITKLVSNILK